MLLTLPLEIRASGYVQYCIQRNSNFKEAEFCNRNNFTILVNSTRTEICSQAIYVFSACLSIVSA